jgi:predicted metal-dependent hydrolase
MALSIPLSSQAERALYREGIRLFNSHQFFAAHEVWEDAWRACVGVKRDYYQGLIQCAVALEHYRRGNSRGVLSLFASYQKHFARVPSQFMGMDVKRLEEAMLRSLAPVLERVPPAERGEMVLDPALAPQMVLMFDPFEND